MTIKGVEERSPRVVELDPILEELGAFGRFQLLNYALMLLPVVFTALFTTSYVFTAADDPHRCWIAECEPSNSSVFAPEWLQDEWTVGRCSRHVSAHNHSTGPAADVWGEGSCDVDTLDDTTVAPCDAWIYKDHLSIVSEFGLACADWRRTLVGTVNNLGQLVCLPLTGAVSDRWGRRTALVAGITLSGALGLLRSFSPNYASFLALEFLDPAFGSGVYSSAFILAVELVGPKYRVLCGSVVASYYALGEVLMGLAAWAVPYWRDLLRLVYTPSLLLLAYFWLAPESVRWLLAKGRASDAKRQLDRAATFNRVHLSDKSLENLYHNMELERVPSEKEKQVKDQEIKSDMNDVKRETFRDALRSGRLILRVACCSWMWITCTLLYYGISLSAATLAGDKYLNFILVSLVELPAYAATMAALAYSGRRPSLATSFVLGGVACLAFAVVPEGMSWLSMMLFLGGKFFITVAFTVLYVYTTELFPTPLRHSLLATCSMLGRIGSIVAPQAPLLATVAACLPYVVFGSAALLAGGLVLTFPETRGAPLPDTIAQALDMSRAAPYATTTHTASATAGNPAADTRVTNL